MAERRTKVAIVGFTPHRKYVPWDDEEFEIWGLNGLYQYPDCKRFNRWFDLHPFDVIGKERLEAYSQMEVPVYLVDQHPEVPTSVAFPKEKVIGALGGRRYYTNSISWMVALAICENFEEIHVYGVDMAQGTEYVGQRPGLEYILGKAEGMGRKVYVPTESDLLSATHLYGFEHDAGLRKRWKEKQKELQGRINLLAQHEEKAKNERLMLMGALQQVNHNLQSWSVADYTSMEPDHPDIPDEAA